MAEKWETQIYSNVGELRTVLAPQDRLRSCAPDLTAAALSHHHVRNVAGNDYRFRRRHADVAAQCRSSLQKASLVLSISTQPTAPCSSQYGDRNDLHPGDLIETGRDQIGFVRRAGAMILDRRQSRWVRGSRLAAAALVSRVYVFYSDAHPPPPPPHHLPPQPNPPKPHLLPHLPSHPPPTPPPTTSQPPHPPTPPTPHLHASSHTDPTSLLASDGPLRGGFHIGVVFWPAIGPGRELFFDPLPAVLRKRYPPSSAAGPREARGVSRMFLAGPVSFY